MGEDGAFLVGSGGNRGPPLLCFRAGVASVQNQTRLQTELFACRFGWELRPMLKWFDTVIVLFFLLACPLTVGAQSCVQSGVVAGGDHTCAFTVGGRMTCWGDNSNGQTGNGTFITPTPAPTEVVALPTNAFGNARLHAVVAGKRHTCASITQQETPWCWGDNAAGQLGDGCAESEAADHRPVWAGSSNLSFFASLLAAGDLHSCAIVGAAGVAGNVLCWGSNRNSNGTQALGQLGDGNVEARRCEPNFSSVGILTGAAVDISAGRFHTCAVLSDSTVRCWGDNSSGQIGNSLPCEQGNPTPNLCVALTPQEVTAFPITPPITPLSNATQVTAGDAHTCVLDGTPGFVQCWGDNTFGQLGTSEPCPVPRAPPGTCPTPRLVAISNNFFLTEVQQIAAGGHHTCALMRDSTVQCWGSNSKGQLGNSFGVPLGSFSPTPAPVMADRDGQSQILTGVAQIAAGNNHTCAALLAGGIKCWGDNSLNQLGVYSATVPLSPVAINANSPCTCSELALCNGQCVNMSGDPRNCGQCGRACSGEAICVSGACICPSGFTLCGEQCVDLQSNNAHCGRCNNRCRIRPPCTRVGECTACDNGECVPF
jgi:alpha-tubulin suppressor-like RCC1 family protein